MISIRLKELSTTKLRDLNNQKDEYDSVYFHPDSLESATVAAGSVIQMVDAVLSQTAGSGVCVVRPPGHHADEDTPSGFCLLNNAVLAARYAINFHGVKRILLLDWDVHHGNGTQNLTYSDDRILYMSIHRYDDASFFPYSKDADHVAVGEGKGEGFNVNIPWNKRGMGDAEYMAAFTQVVLPIAYQYNPELVIVSAGFDACVGDPLGGCKVTPECYGRMTQLLRGLAGGRIILCLEGGYNITSISYAMTMCTKALLGDPIKHHHDPRIAVHWSAVETINNVIKTHKKYWKCLKFQLALPVENVIGEPLPSRGLIINEDSKISDKLETSLPTKLEDTEKEVHRTTKSLGDLGDSDPLQSEMSKLTITPKCDDGIHCGTDDEETTPSPFKNPSKDKSVGSKSSSKCEAKEKRDLEAVPESSKTGPSSTKTSEESKTLVDYLAENMQAIVDGEMFAVIPLPWCPHLDGLFAIPSDVKFEQGVKCVDCDHTVENWVCLHCYITACGRSINGHMQAHYRATSHALVLSLSDLSVWCNECDAYVDNALLYDYKNNAHRCKFNEDMPWHFEFGGGVYHIKTRESKKLKMSRHSERIGDRIAEEAQLLAEEKWIIEALNQIKKQRNALQIERLQLESHAAKLRQKKNLENKRTQASAQAEVAKEQQNPPAVQTPGKTRDNIQFEVPIASEALDALQILDFDACNDEELDLAVSESVFSNEQRRNVQEYEEDDDEDDGGDTLIDMNMFMNSNRSNSGIR
ncbi:histone deacetylase domain-containing protein [Phthorimaea operculella]|nr:histone deacetylase domain-containing protein [Phthorimaea operculella]